MTFVYGGQRQSVAFQSVQCRSVGREVEKTEGVWSVGRGQRGLQHFNGMCQNLHAPITLILHERVNIHSLSK